MPIGDPDSFSASGAPTYAQPALPDAVCLADLVRRVIALEVERLVAHGEIAAIQQTLASKHVPAGDASQAAFCSSVDDLERFVNQGPTPSLGEPPHGDAPEFIHVSVPCVLTRVGVESGTKDDLAQLLASMARNLVSVVIGRLKDDAWARGWTPKGGW